MFQKKDIKIYLIMLLTSLIMCGGFVTGHYSTDDYNIMNIGYVKYSIQNNLREGRPLMTLIDLLYDKLHISYNVFIISTVVIAIILSCLNIILLYHLLEKYTKKKNKYVIYCILFSSIFSTIVYVKNPILKKSKMFMPYIISHMKRFHYRLL